LRPTIDVDWRYSLSDGIDFYMESEQSHLWLRGRDMSLANIVVLLVLLLMGRL